MKSIYLLPIILLSYVSNAQDTVDIDLSFIPDLESKIELTMDSYVSVEFDEQDLIMQGVDPDEFENPILNSFNNESVSTIRTGSKDSLGNFALQVEYVLNRYNGEKGGIPDGTMAFGNIVKGAAVIDSIVSDSLWAIQKYYMKKTIQDMLNQAMIPSMKLALNDHYIHHMPFEMPMGDIVLTMDLIYDYHLVDIQDNIAKLEIAIDYDASGLMEDTNFEGVGKGTGHMFYNLDLHNVDVYYALVDLEMHGVYDGVKMTIKNEGIMEIKGEAKHR